MYCKPIPLSPLFDTIYQEKAKSQTFSRIFLSGWASLSIQNREKIEFCPALSEAAEGIFVDIIDARDGQGLTH